jgi:hypothetical protein
MSETALITNESTSAVTAFVFDSITSMAQSLTSLSESVSMPTMPSNTAGALDAHTMTVNWLVDPDPRMRCTGLHALNKADQATITAHITYVGGMLTDLDPGVRGSAVIVIGRDEQETLTAYTGTIASMLKPGHDGGVRYIACS